MTQRERFAAAIRGHTVDRPPIWLREGFEFHAMADKDDFTKGWQADPEYRAFCEFAREHCAVRAPWSPGAQFNRLLGIAPRHIQREIEWRGPDVRRHITTVETGEERLRGVVEVHRGEATGWHVDYPVKTKRDLDLLRALPFEVAPVSYERYEQIDERVGDSGLPSLGVSSPWVVFSSVMPFDLALEWSVTESGMVHDVLAEITERALQCLNAVLSRPLDTMANIGGCEQCTPPMMSPQAFAEFVTPYDSKLIRRLKDHGIAVNCHCHGRVSTALAEMIAMGCDATDPVEPPVGGGDVTMAQAREIVGDKLTLCGNLQFEELARSTPEHIRQRVRTILATGRQRLVVSASAGPISRPTTQMLDNYRALIDEVLKQT